MKINRNLIGRGCLTIALDTIYYELLQRNYHFFFLGGKNKSLYAVDNLVFFFKVCWSLKDYSGGMLVFFKFSVLYNYIFTFEVNKI